MRNKTSASNSSQRSSRQKKNSTRKEPQQTITDTAQNDGVGSPQNNRKRSYFVNEGVNIFICSDDPRFAS